MAEVLRIEQNHDLVTEYGQAFRDVLVFDNFTLSYPNHSLYTSVNAQATRTDVDAVLNGRTIRFVSGFGHGTYSSFTEQGGTRSLWDTTDSFANLAGAIVHLTSCETGAQLGREMVIKGVAAFWGYTVEFRFTHADPAPTPRHTDTLAEPFFRMDSIIDLGVLNGDDAATIFNAVSRHVAAVFPTLSPTQQALLLDNYVHLVGPATTWGDVGATI